MSKPTMVSLDWVLNQLDGQEFPGQGRAYDFIRSSWEAGQKADFQNVYNPEYRDALCVCGHPYYRHFDVEYDPFDDGPAEHFNAGCKYCGGPDSLCPDGFVFADEDVAIVLFEELGGVAEPEVTGDKRTRRRAEREKEKGPERRILSFHGGTAEAPEWAFLECGHQIHNPPIQKTKRMLLPKEYRCIQCRDIE